ncbi:MAG TPA: DUF4058 family protein [Anaerolineae bacterium]|nr:DUF4058 family protein [Anaerolineae bacterium]
MKSPFPGMDPYLEHHALWPDVHNSLITALRDVLAPLVAPHYYVGVESRAYVMKHDGDHFLGRPDVSVIGDGGQASRPSVPAVVTDEVAFLEVELPIWDEVDHYYLEVRAVRTDELVTLIEVLSPVNKVSRAGRGEYLQKRQDVLQSQTNLIEIDLLRSGEPMPLNQQVVSDYRILVSPGWLRRKAHLYAFNLPMLIPSFPLPLMPDEEQPMIHLNDILHQLYERARFDLRLDYGVAAVPPLGAKYDVWFNELIVGRDGGI